MDNNKKPRFPYFDFSEHPLDPEALRAHFAVSLDAVTVCRFSESGKHIFHHRHVNKDQPRHRFYRLTDQGGGQRWQHVHHLNDCERGRPVHFPGDGMMFGRLHAHVAKLDAHVHGPHPIGTQIKILTVDNTVSAGKAQWHGILHMDGNADTVRRHGARPIMIYDYIDDSGLPTLYVDGYNDADSDPLYSHLLRNAQLLYDDRVDHASLPQRQSCIKALELARTRLRSAVFNSLVMRTLRTPHTGQVADKPTRRAHANLIVVRP